MDASCAQQESRERNPIGPGLEHGRFWVLLGGRVRGPLALEDALLIHGVGFLSLVCPEKRNPKNRRNWGFARRYLALRGELCTPPREHGGRMDSSAGDAAPKAGAPVPPQSRARRDMPAARVPLSAWSGRLPDARRNETGLQGPPKSPASPPGGLRASLPGERLPDRGQGRRGSRLHWVALAVCAGLWLNWRTPASPVAGHAKVSPGPSEPWREALELVFPGCATDAMREQSPAVSMTDSGNYTIGFYSDAVGEEVLFEWDEGSRQLRPLNAAASKSLDFRNPCP